MKEVSWIVQFNPTSPNHFSVFHLVKDETKHTCLCNQMVNSYGKDYTDFDVSLEKMKELLRKEEELRQKHKGTNLEWEQKVYCLRCLRKAIKENEE